MNANRPNDATMAQSREPPRGRGPLLWIKRGLLGLVIGLIALAVSGAIYQAIATDIYKRTYPPPGGLVEVGGHLMHINCIGEGTPTVILDAALPGMSAHWVRKGRGPEGSRPLASSCL